MGIAAYNRGSAAISRGILMDAGRWREPRKPNPRDVTWGNKAAARALDRARRVLATNLKIGRHVSFSDLVEIVADRERVSVQTATLAVTAAMRRRVKVTGARKVSRCSICRGPHTYKHGKA